VIKPTRWASSAKIGYTPPLRPHHDYRRPILTGAECLQAGEARY
jgi:hypothetical protein